MSAELMRCRELRNNGRKFELGDNCWFDPTSPQIAKEHPWATYEWIVDRGPEWVIREVSWEGVWASYKIEHAPTFFEFDALIPYVPGQKNESTDSDKLG